MRLFEKNHGGKSHGVRSSIYKEKRKTKKRTFVCVNVSRGTYKEEERKK
jgi:hypothetical protein